MLNVYESFCTWCKNFIPNVSCGEKARLLTIAAVGSARNEQHGKGFALVDEKFRNLAASSAKTAKETPELITLFQNSQLPDQHLCEIS